MQPVVALGAPVHLAASSAQDQDVAHKAQIANGLVHIFFEGNALGSAHALVGRDDDGGASVDDAVVDGLGRKAGENDGVNGADAGAGEHGDADFGDDGHVDGDGVTTSDATALEQIGHATDVVVQLLIRDDARVGELVALPQQSGLLCTTRKMAVHTVEAHVELGVQKPGNVPALEAAAPHLSRRRKQRKLRPKLLHPERIRVGPNALLVQCLVCLERRNV